MYAAFAPAQPGLTLGDLLSPARQNLPIAAEASVRSPAPGSPAKKDESRLGIETTARAAVAVDWTTGAPLFEKNADEPLAIASITKLMTALVLLSSDPDWQSVITMNADDQRSGNVPYIKTGERVTVENLFNMSLVASSNEATVALARSTGLSLDDFANKMNEMAAKVGMTNSHFTEPTGLDGDNVASARDVALLLRTAFTRPEIRDAARLKSYSFTALSGMPHSVRSTDELLGSFLDRDPYKLLGGKTGFIQRAGYCFGAAAENADGDRVIAVVLGTDSKELRFKEVKALIYWAFDAYQWPKELARR